MRPDVKLGVVISMVVVLVAGTYYLYRDGREQPIPLAERPEVLSPPGPVDQPTDAIDRPESPRDRRFAKKTSRREAPPMQRGLRSADRESSASRPVPVGPSPERVADSPDVRRAGPDPGTDSRTVPSDSPAVARADETRDEPLADARRAVPGRTRRPTPLSATRAHSPAVAVRTRSTPREAAVETHRVQSGDTLSSLAQQYYGSARYTRFLAEHNPQITDPNVLRVGTIVRIAPLPADHERAPTGRDISSDAGAMKRTRTYRVEPGDSFYSIARNVLGDATRWKELFELNREAVDGEPTRLRIGQVLTLPAP